MWLYIDLLLLYVRFIHRGFHVKCILTCCSYTSRNSNVGATMPDQSMFHACLPTEHVYRVDTEMCGICHFFSHRLSALSERERPECPMMQQKKRRKRKKNPMFEADERTLSMAETIWHLKPNARRSKMHAQNLKLSMLNSDNCRCNFWSDNLLHHLVFRSSSFKSSNIKHALATMFAFAHPNT